MKDKIIDILVDFSNDVLVYSELGIGIEGETKNQERGRYDEYNKYIHGVADKIIKLLEEPTPSPKYKKR